MSGGAADEARSRRILAVRADRRRSLRYGENPHQAAALYAAGDSGFGGARVVQGKPLSFTNLLDLDAAARLAREFDEPAAVVVKHTNPCGVATAGALSDGLRDGAGGRFPVRVRRDRGVEPLPRRCMTAEAVASTFIEAVVAPDADDEARAVLASKKNLRLVLADCLVGRRRPAGARHPVHSRRGSSCRAATA